MAKPTAARERPVGLLAAAFVALVVIQTGSVLLFKGAQTKQSTYTFNPAAQMVLAEVTKLLISLFLLHRVDRAAAEACAAKDSSTSTSSYKEGSNSGGCAGGRSDHNQHNNRRAAKGETTPPSSSYPSSTSFSSAASTRTGALMNRGGSSSNISSGSSAYVLFGLFPRLGTKPLIGYACLATGYAVNNQLTYHILTTSNPGLLSLAKSSTPLLIAAMSALLFKEKLSRIQWQCVVLQVCGMVSLFYSSGGGSGGASSLSPSSTSGYGRGDGSGDSGGGGGGSGEKELLFGVQEMMGGNMDGSVEHMVGQGGSSGQWEEGNGWQDQHHQQFGSSTSSSRSSELVIDAEFASPLLLIGAACLLTAACSSLNAHLLHQGAFGNLHAQNSVLYGLGALVNFAFFLAHSTSPGHIGFFSGYSENPISFLLLLSNALVGLVVTFVYRLGNAVVKTLAVSVSSAILLVFPVFFDHLRSRGGEGGGGGGGGAGGDRGGGGEGGGAANEERAVHTICGCVVVLIAALMYLENPPPSSRALPSSPSSFSPSSSFSSSSSLSPASPSPPPSPPPPSEPGLSADVSGSVSAISGQSLSQGGSSSIQRLVPLK